jgi:hypothetical protein
VTTAYINKIATGVPFYEVHGVFVDYALSLLDKDARSKRLLLRMIEKSGIEQRYSCLAPAPDCPSGPALDTSSLYIRGRPTNTAARMRVFETRAPELAANTVEKLAITLLIC